MKKYLLLYKILFLSVTGYTQLTINPGLNWVNSGNITVSLHNLDFVNNGAFIAGNSSMKFTGNQNSNISGTSLPFFNILEIAKTNGTNVSLNSNVSIGSSLNFISGQLDLNNYHLSLTSSAFIAGESENNRITGANGGFIEITQDMNAPASVNAGNLGATISSSADLGSVTIRRGHLQQSGTGLVNSIHRYYLITPTNNSNLNSTLRLRYFDAELNGQDENSLVIYQSNNSGTDWSNLSKTGQNTNGNYVEKTGVAFLTLQTLANNNVQLPDGVSGLVFTGQRKKPTEVQLNWTTQTETNMSGYEVQRRLDNEPDFSPRSFVNSSASGGNSFSPLPYQYKDANPYTGISYYRLKIVTLTGFSYSNVISVAGKNKGGGNNNREVGDDITAVNGKTLAQANSSTQKISVGPNPNNGNFWFSVNGIEKETVATLYAIDGKQIKQFRVVNLQRQQVSNIRAGIYLLKVPGFETQKIIVNGGGNGAFESRQAIINNSKL